MNVDCSNYCIIFHLKLRSRKRTLCLNTDFWMFRRGRWTRFFLFDFEINWDKKNHAVEE